MKVQAAIGVIISATVTTCAAAEDRKENRPDPLVDARIEVYKTINDVALKTYIFAPDGHQPTDRRPAVVFFFGGGFRRGSPQQFAHQCRYLASRGMVAMTADYRVSSRHNVKVVQCLADGKSAVRWVRRNAKRLGIDPERIAAGGGSAGGCLAAMTGTIDAFTEPGEDTAVSARPNALLLFNPRLDFRIRQDAKVPPRRTPAEQRERLGVDPVVLSPVLHIDDRTPTTIIFHGKADKVVPFAEAEAFTRAMRNAGNRCELVAYADQGHGFFNHGRDGGRPFTDTMRQADRFLTSLGWLQGEPTIDQFK